MKKLFLGMFLALILILTSSPTYAATTQIKVDGVTIVSDVNPESKSNRTMVPLRVISENLGANVKWSDSQVTLTKKDMKVILKLNSNKVVKNGKTELLDVKPY
ncbi:MAG: copper amine oxidase N-terminal domain-containing protein, partial [Solibacillus sp.]